MCERCEELEAEVEYLRSELGLCATAAEVQTIKRAFRVTRGAAMVILRLFYNTHNYASKLQVEEAVPSAKGSDERCVKTSDVYVCQIRKALGADAIETIWSLGFRMTDRGRELVKEALGQSQRMAAE